MKYMYVVICFDQLKLTSIHKDIGHDFKWIYTYHIWSTLAISRHAKQTQDNLAMSSTSRYKKIFSTSSGGREIKSCFFLSPSEDIVRAWPKQQTHTTDKHARIIKKCTVYYLKL